MTPNKPLTIDAILSHYPQIARVMELMTASRSAKIDYNFMADAIVWSDELPASLDWLGENAMRPVLRYRTSQLLGKPERTWEKFWNAAKTAFPDWIGFNENRCTPTNDLEQLFFKLRSGKMIPRANQ